MTLRARSFVVFATLLLSAACGSSSKSGGSPATDDAGSGGDAAADPFVGSWVCTGNDVLTFTKPAGAPTKTDPFTTDVTIVANPDGSQTATGTGDGATCALESTVSGDTTTLEGGQSCVNADGVTADYTSGMNTITSATTYSIMRAFTFSGTVTEDGGSTLAVAGTGATTGTCTKQ